LKADRYGVAEDVDASRSTALDLIGATEGWLVLVILALAAGLAFSTDTFLTLSNLFDPMNTSAVNVIFASGLLVVLIAGGIDISFAVGASVV
jgi:simple sugar transport system permease protein